jgi:hypothetical protein
VISLNPLSDFFIDLGNIDFDLFVGGQVFIVVKKQGCLANLFLGYYRLDLDLVVVFLSLLDAYLSLKFSPLLEKDFVDDLLQTFLAL